MPDTPDRTPSEDELRARAAKIAALLEEAVREARELCELPKPPHYDEMLEGAFPHTAAGKIISEAIIMLDNGASDVPERLEAWERLVTVTQDELDQKWRERQAREEARRARRGIAPQVVQ